MTETITQHFWHLDPRYLLAAAITCAAYTVLMLQRRVGRLERALIALAEDVDTPGAWEAACKLVPPGMPVPVTPFARDASREDQA